MLNDIFFSTFYCSNFLFNLKLQWNICFRRNKYALTGKGGKGGSENKTYVDHSDEGGTSQKTTTDKAIICFLLS